MQLAGAGGPWERSYVTVKAVVRTLGNVEFDTGE